MVDPKIQQFLILNGLIVLIVVGYILYRPRRHAMKLKMNGQASQKTIDAMSQKIQMEQTIYEEAAAKPGEKELNVIFQFNGHSFDAYEVLGVPAGASEQTVEEAYSALLKSTDKESHEFYCFAYKAIQKHNL